jgi:hypothetical protein
MSQNHKGYIIRIRESRAFRGMAVCLALNLLFEMIQPSMSWALTEGPSQPEVQSFEPVTTTQMVDPFTGDFNYNIPLFNLPGPNGGYPINLAYHAGATMDDEASWVGLGWNINVGSLVRNMRGLPDEFESTLVDEDGITDLNGNDENDDKDVVLGDYLHVKSDIKQSWTLGTTGSIGQEVLGIGLEDAVGINASANVSVYYNNFNGVGASAGANMGNAVSSGSNWSFGLSLDSENGAGVSAAYSTNARGNWKGGTNTHKLSLSFDGSLSVDYALARTEKEMIEVITTFATGVTGTDYKMVEKSGKYGSGVSFARNNFSPSVATKLNSYSLSMGYSKGIETTGLFSYKGINVFYNTEDMDDDEKNGMKRPVIGYAKAGNNNSNKFTRDFIRSNDGQITKDSKFLAHSQYAYDVYNSSGQGLSGYFRARRSDVGRSFDPYVFNDSYGMSGSVDVGVGPTGDVKTGVDISGKFGYSSSGPWDINNDIPFDFENPEPFGIEENMYYQAHGEPTILDSDELDHIGGLDLPRMRLQDKSGDGLGNGKRKIGIVEESVLGHRSNKREVEDRVVRNTLIHNLKNKEVGALGEFRIKYFEKYGDITTSTPTDVLDRASRLDYKEEAISIGEHPAGFKILNDQGSYYVYGLPAYNNSDISNLFSVEMPDNAAERRKVGYPTDSNGEVEYEVGSANLANSHKFINKTVKSPYAHSHLLTSVLGADYVDIHNDGPSDDDLGYWVKFNYAKYRDNYKWRAPYTGAMYNRGQTFTSEDDKASYQYGEKEIWYLGQMETKSHIAVFKMSEREDMKESGGEHNTTAPSASGLKIDEIKIYEKKAFQADIDNGTQDAIPLQVVHFEYDYTLCQNAPNSDAAGTSGKLTLKKLYFTSNGSTRGSRNKYEFNYGSGLLKNPDYAESAYDSWGGYKPQGSSVEHQVNFPYINQFNQNWAGTAWEPNYAGANVDDASRLVTKQTQDDLAAAWCLSEIILPSGGKINIDYESDDYGYVQHKTANQMFKIEKMGDYPNGEGDDELYFDVTKTNEYEQRRIYFKLEIPLDPGISNPGKVIYDQYVAPLIKDENGERNLYFKSKVRLTMQVYDYVSGYLPLEDYTEADYGVHVDLDGNGKSKWGFVTMKKALKREKNNGQPVYFDKYHPMSLSAWMHLQTNASKLLHNPNSLQNEGNYNSPKDLMSKMVDLLNIVPATMNSFGAIRAYCKSKNMAKYIDLEKSVIRLASPDKIKYGGGHRVRQIKITDQWGVISESGGSNNRSYGQKYDYTIEEDGKTISSGVAQYEPQAGGDENALKYPIYYYAKQSVFTKNNLFAEAPLNEDMFPGASVGYRKVSVTSINTNTQIDRQKVQDDLGNGDLPVGQTGGVTVHEFYTSKEFPTMVEMSNLAEENYTKDVFNVPIPIPLVGSIKRNYFHGTQAYKIELNDMHGKMKSVKSYELNDYRVNDSPITSTYHEYQSDVVDYNDETVFKLDNLVSIISKDGNHTIDTEKRLMGVEYDLFTDQRESKTFSQSAGVEWNTDIIAAFPIMPVWPSFTNHKTIMRTYVNNKVIHRTGIMKRSVTKDLQTSNESEIIAYDEKSGQPLVTKMTNEFGDDFFNYNIPAYYAYDRMGHAYQNINYNFNTVLRRDDPTDHMHSNELYNFIPTNDQLAHLVRGDEMITSNVLSIQGTTSGNTFTYSFGNGRPPIVFTDVQTINGLLYGFNSNGAFVLVVQPLYSTGFEVSEPYTVDAYALVPANDYQKCYFVGWQYDDQEIVRGVIKFILPLDDAAIGVNGDVKLVTDLKVIRSGRRNLHSTMAASYLTKGSINTNPSPLGTVLLGKDFDDVPIHSESINANTLLSASASTFTDNWSENPLSADLTIGTKLYSYTVDRDINPFISGSSGIFRPEKSYSYTGRRSASASMEFNNTPDPTLELNPDLRSDGTFELDVPLFQWDLGLMEDFLHDWEWVNEVTRYSNDSYEIENKNRLDIYSSALYGYDNSLTIAVGGNASYHELGVEDFETVPTTTPWTGEERMEQNNLNFYSTPAAKEYSISAETYSIEDAQYNFGSLFIKIQKPSDETVTYFQNSVDYPSGLEEIKRTFGLTLTSEKSAGTDGNKSYFLNGTCSYANYDASLEELTIKISPYLHCFNEPERPMPEGLVLNGKITTYSKKAILHTGNSSITTNVVSIATDKAHTGKKSMAVNSTAVFDQPLLRSIENKKYITSVWVSRDNDKVRSFEPASGDDLIIPGYMSGSNFTAFQNYKIQYGKVVEGWQKIDVEFSNSDIERVVAFEFNPGTTTMYVDDFRYSPKLGGITTYVYDADKFWLRASLNVDNYATLFFYDEEGNLTIKKQETEKGIFTITESRGHIADPIGNDPDPNGTD